MQSDADWLSPEPHGPTSQRHPSATPDARVSRDDGDGVVTRYHALTVAIADPPGTPEAVILDADRRCLAMAHPDEACEACDDEGRCASGPWVLTATGRDRLAAERRAA